MSLNRESPGFSRGEYQLVSKAPQAAFTAAHETGHYIDHHAFGESMGFGSSDESPHLKGVMQAIHKSPESRELARELRKKNHPNKKYIKYIADLSEQFARAYSQYIAHKSQHPILAEGLRLDRAKLYGKIEHWSDDNFRPIAAEFDKAFKAKGWLHEG